MSQKARDRGWDRIQKEMGMVPVETTRYEEATENLLLIGAGLAQRGAKLVERVTTGGLASITSEQLEGEQVMLEYARRCLEAVARAIRAREKRSA